MSMHKKRLRLCGHITKNCMKKIYFFILLLSAFQLAYAQNDSLERAIQLGYYTSYNCAVTQDSGQYFYLAFAASDIPLGVSAPPYIVKLAELGDTLWMREAFDSSIYEAGEVKQIIFAHDSDMVLSGYKMFCDVAMGNGYVEKKILTCLCL